MKAMIKWIDFDIHKIKRLKNEYEELKQFILDELPPVNWNSILETKAYFSDTYWLDLVSTQIAYLQTFELDENNSFTSDLAGLIELKKVQFFIRNYIDCILRHEKNGRIHLRNIDGKWLMPNKQPLPYSSQIKDAIIGEGEYLWEQ